MECVEAEPAASQVAVNPSAAVGFGHPMATETKGEALVGACKVKSLMLIVSTSCLTNNMPLTLPHIRS